MFSCELCKLYLLLLLWIFRVASLRVWFINISPLVKSYKQGVQGLKAFPFCVVTVNGDHPKPRFKRKRRVKYNDDICAELCLKLRFECNLYFCKKVSKAIVHKQNSKRSLRQVSSEAAIRRYSSKLVFHNNFTTRKHLCWSLFLIKLDMKKRLHHRYFPVNIMKLSRTAF